MRKTVLVIATLVLAGLATAQPGFITTTYAANNGGAANWTNFFTCNVTNPHGLKITSMDVNISGSTAVNFSVAIYTSPTTYVGKEANASSWLKVSVGAAKSAGQDKPSPVDVTDFVLQPGQYGIAINYTGAGMRYTNGTGTGPTGNQNYSNADIGLQCGSAIGGLFTGTMFTPRVWNGTIYYESYVAATITGSGAGSINTTYNFSLNSPNAPKLNYGVGSALGNGPIVIDTRRIRLSLDPLLLASTGGTLPSVFANYSGVLDTSGRGTASLVIPNNAALKGLRIYTAFVTAKASAPSGISTISNTFDFRIN